jgi:hypothetical protein
MTGPDPIWDRPAAEKRFIESDLTLAQVAAEFHVSRSQLSKWAAKNTWTSKRRAFKRRPAMVPPGNPAATILEAAEEVAEEEQLTCPHCGGALNRGHLLGLVYDIQDRSILTAAQGLFDAIQKEMKKIADDEAPVPAMEYDMMSRALERVMKMQRVTFGKDKRVPVVRGALPATSSGVGGDLMVGSEADSTISEIDRIQALLDQARVWALPPDLKPGDPLVEHVS